MPDLVLHGTSSDEKLKQCLAADLAHTVHVSDPSVEQLDGQQQAFQFMLKASVWRIAYEDKVTR